MSAQRLYSRPVQNSCSGKAQRELSFEECPEIVHHVFRVDILLPTKLISFHTTLGLIHFQTRVRIPPIQDLFRTRREAVADELKREIARKVERLLKRIHECAILFAPVLESHDGRDDDAHRVARLGQFA